MTRYRILKRIAAVALLVFLMVLCAPLAHNAGFAADKARASFLPPLASAWQTDRAADYLPSAATIALYIPASSFTSVRAVIQTITVCPYEMVYEGAIKELLRQIRALGNEENRSINLFLLSIARTNGIISVNLSGDAAVLSDQEIFLLAYCIANTLTEFHEINYVNVLIDDKAISLEGVPYGTLSHFTTDAPTAFWQATTRAASILAESGASYRSSVSLYYGAPHTNLLCGEVREISVYANSERILSELVAELAKGPRNRPDMVRLLPSGAFLSSYDISLTQKNTNRISLLIGGSAYNYFIRNNIDPVTAVASIALTVFDYYPNTEYISVAFTDNFQERYDDITRTYCELTLGSSIMLYFPNSNSSLITPVERFVPSFDMSRAQTLLGEMFRGPMPQEANAATGMMPQGTTVGDILSIEFNGSQATVNLSSYFIDELFKMEPENERKSLYCIVNTLCGTKGISSVLFLMEGQPCENYPGRINLGEALYYNPGIIGKGTN